jgi:hypothetical protein
MEKTQVDRRIEQMEKGLRRLKLYSAALTGVLVLLLLGALRPHGTDVQVLRARGLVIVDEAGRERILLGAPIPGSSRRVRTDPARVEQVWAGRYPDPRQYLQWYEGYRHRMHGLLILDENGFDRVAIGDSVPDPNIGKRIGPATGLVINDHEGFERSGYGLLNVSGSYRVVLGLDSDRGVEGLTLSLFDEGGVGLAVRQGDESLFLGNAPPNHWAVGSNQAFHGLLLRKGSDVAYQINTAGTQ